MVQKILFLAANPKGTTQLRLDEEVREIDAGLQRAKHRDHFVLEEKWAVRPRDIQRAMLDINLQIIHFFGHRAEDEGLVFEDEIGQVKLVDGEALAGLFELFADQIECVVLNGCYSEVQAKDIAQHVNYVIGMKKAIGDRAAIEFAVGFYDALGAGHSVEFAYKFGCAAIRLAGIPEELTPTFKKKPGLIPTEEFLQTISSLTNEVSQEGLSTQNSTSCVDRLGQLEKGQLRRLMVERLSLSQVRNIWFDTLGNQMDDFMSGRNLQDCVIELLQRAEQRRLTNRLIECLCTQRSDIAANPYVDLPQLTPGVVGYNLATFTEGRKSKSQQTNNAKNKLLTGIVTIAITVILPVIVYLTGSIKDSTSTPTATSSPDSSKDSTSTPTGTSSPDSSIEKLEGHFNVYAKNREGYRFTNPQNKLAKINFQANGRWIAQPGPGRGSTDAEGYRKDGTPIYYSNSLLDSAPAASLIVRYEDQGYEYVGKDKTLILKPKESIYFLMNDNFNLYRDNEGKITVTWSVINSPQ